MVMIRIQCGWIDNFKARTYLSNESNDNHSKFGRDVLCLVSYVVYLRFSYSMHGIHICDLHQTTVSTSLYPPDPSHPFTILSHLRYPTISVPILLISHLCSYESLICKIILTVFSLTITHFHHVTNGHLDDSPCNNPRHLDTSYIQYPALIFSYNCGSNLKCEDI